MNSGMQKSLSLWALRLGLGFMFLYSGLDLVRHPTGWYWAVRPLPDFIKNIITDEIGMNRYLMLQGVGELVMAFVFLAWFLPAKIVKIVAALAAAEMAAILLLVGLNSETFRDIGLLGAGAALFFL